MEKERLGTSQNKFQNVRKGRNSSRVLFSGVTLAYQTVAAGPCRALSSRDSLTLRFLLEKEKITGTLPRKNFLSETLKNFWCGW